MKRYIIECANDFIKACKSANRYDLVEKLNRVRNAYISGTILATDALKSLLKIIEE